MSPRNNVTNLLRYLINLSKKLRGFLDQVIDGTSFQFGEKFKFSNLHGYISFSDQFRKNDPVIRKTFSIWKSHRFQLSPAPGNRDRTAGDLDKNLSIIRAAQHETFRIPLRCIIGRGDGNSIHNGILNRYFQSASSPIKIEIFCGRLVINRQGRVFIFWRVSRSSLNLIRWTTQVF